MMNRLTIQLLTVIAALISSVSVSAVELLNLTTTEQGMHRVTYEELLAQGADLAGLKVNRFERPKVKVMANVACLVLVPI